jgi:GntR family transcriptional regulator
MMKRFPEGWRARPVPVTPEEVAERLRCVIVGRLHAGWIAPGDRLPSIREVADQMHLDHRVVGEAYRLLEREQLVVVREKSGVFAVAPQYLGSRKDEVMGWAAGVLYEAWERQISRSELCSLFGGTGPPPLRCACIESNEDHMVALCGELEAGLSVRAVPIFVHPAVRPDDPPPPGLAEVEIVTTSVFHAKYAAAAAAAMGKPCVVLALRKDFASSVSRLIERGPVIAVISDPRYAERAGTFLATPARDAVRFVTVDEAERGALDLAGEGVMVTRAARRRLGLEDCHLLPTLPRLISEQSQRELCRAIVDLGARV